jgi:hypothetical protein
MGSSVAIPAAIMVQMTDRLIRFADYITAMAEKPDNDFPEIRCSKGCSYCCHAQVKITWPEALLLNQFVRETFSQPEKTALLKRAAHNRMETEGKTLAQRVSVRAETPCIFLEKNTCLVYSARPLICRAWHSLDEVACCKAFNDGDHNADIELNPHRNFIYGTIKEVFTELCVKYKLDQKIYELPFIVEQTISDAMI